MSLENEMAKAIRFAIRKGIPVIVTEGNVTAVDKDKHTCDVDRPDLPDLPAVRLNATLDPGNDIITVFPKVGSKVLCILVENQPADAFMLTATDIEEISVKIGDMTILVNKDNIQFNDGQLGGMVKAKELKTQIDKNTEVLKALLQILTGTTINEPGNGAPSALQLALSAVLAGKQTADLSSIENSKIKH
jgi:hypothetical protein